MAASIEAPSAGPRSTRSCGKCAVIAFTASYTAFWTRAMVRIVLGPSVAISVVLSAQSATVSARAPSATNKKAIAPQRQTEPLMNTPGFFESGNSGLFAEHWRGANPSLVAQDLALRARESHPTGTFPVLPDPGP